MNKKFKQSKAENRDATTGIWMQWFRSGGYARGQVGVVLVQQAGIVQYRHPQNIHNLKQEIK